ncbi:MAG: spore coat protein [Clostridia bacterium]|nr:spore coat protein [Clostridia bacterium]
MSEHSMNERELLTDLLHTEKDMSTTYASNCLEASGPELRALLIRHMTECANDQFTVFNEMRSRSMYNPKQAKPNEITEAKQNMDQLSCETWSC